MDIGGVVKTGSECDVVLRFCFECRDALMKGKNTGKSTPWAAYTNGWTTDSWPEKFRDASEAKINMVVRLSLIHI